MPRHCSYFKVDGHAVIACGGAKIQACANCGEIASKLCDWKLDALNTCDEPMCDRCSNSVGTNRDLCRHHGQIWRNHPANKQQDLAL